MKVILGLLFILEVTFHMLLHHELAENAEVRRIEINVK